MSSSEAQPQNEESKQAPAAGVQSPAAGASVSAPADLSQAPGAAPAIEQGATTEQPIERRQNRGEFGGVDQRKNVVDRRTGLNRRLLDMGSPTGLERRRGPGRRRSDERRSAEEGEMSDDQFE